MTASTSSRSVGLSITAGNDSLETSRVAAEESAVGETLFSVVHSTLSGSRSDTTSESLKCSGLPNGYTHGCHSWTEATDIYDAFSSIV